MTRIVRTIPDLRKTLADWRRDGATVAMVPTMGALHPGHLALVAEAQRRSSRVVATLFVNPAQFAPGEDLGSYPRTEDEDRQKLAEMDTDLLFAPSRDEVYPEGFDTHVVVGGPSAGLETDFRPHFFAGVATVVTKLLLSGLPDQAFFGEKDYQQLLVVRQLVRDLDIPTEIVGCPTVREPDGLALSSRNRYLAPADRKRAPRLHATMRETAGKIRAGDPPDEALRAGREALAQSGFSVDYLEIRNAETLAPVRDWRSEPLRMLAAARLGATRLIDNIAA